MPNMTEISIETAVALPRQRVRGNVVPAHPRVAVLIPCLNEQLMVGGVVADFRRELPDADIWVVDNGSTDNTTEVAAAAGARILREPRRGKGFALRAAFRDIDADVYVLADGDGQLPAESVHALLRPVLEGDADMVVGSRAMAGRTSHKFINNLGNILFSRLLRTLLSVRVTDVLSGYRAMNRMLVKSLPLAARNFEIEVELTIKTSQRSYRIREVPFEVRPRPAETAPHLRVVRDGARIAWAIVLLFRDYRPMAFFGSLGVLLLALSFALFAISGGAGHVGFMSTDTLAILVAASGLLSVASGSVISVLGRRLQELEGKVDMVTTSALLGDEPGDDPRR
jgi:glycosyltransferase involved in cell wall biosynthesis